MAKLFVDTNVVVYANDRRDPAKQERAVALISDLMRHGNGVVSTQVLQEYAATALSKLAQPPEVVQRQLRLLESFEVITVGPELIRRAVELRALYSITYWDAGIIAAAESAGCTDLYSEDLNPGQFYSGVRVVNPFAV